MLRFHNTLGVIFGAGMTWWQAWVASPLARERGRVRVLCQGNPCAPTNANPSPESSPLLRGERRRKPLSDLRLDFERLTKDVISSEAKHLGFSAWDCRKN